MSRCGVLAILLAVALGACGGGGDRSAAGPREVVHEYFTAFARGEAGRACGLLAPAAKRDLRDYQRAVGASLGPCEQALGFLHRRFGARVGPVLERARVTALRVTGSIAVAEVAGADRPLRLVGRAGEWQVARLDFRGDVFRVLATRVCTRYARSARALAARTVRTRAEIVRYLTALGRLLSRNRQGLAAIPPAPAQRAARDELLAGFAEQQRLLTAEVARLRAGASRRSVLTFQRQAQVAGRRVDAAQASLRVSCGQPPQ